eukprot:m.104872 g.104872  ORF g.104872 m.104872 type:complete len:615 (-) comp13862_c0_seq3:107-1951(-)
MENKTGSPPIKRARLGGDKVSASKARPQSGQQDNLFGIECYISKTPGFRAILKQRYEDFHVNEIDRNGNVVKLTDLQPPADNSTVEQVQQKTKETSEGVSQLKTLIGEDKFGELKSAQIEASKVIIPLNPNTSKGERTQIHKLIRLCFAGLESVTKTLDEGSHIEVSQDKGKNKRGKRDSTWDKEKGNHCQFVLHKANKGTMDCISILARKLKLKASRFSYAGTKDSRAVTSQLVTLFKVESKQIAQLNKSLPHYIKVGNFSYVRDKLELGALKGNQFRIVLRDIDGAHDSIQMACKSLREKGFLNYFGMQRFGTSSVPTSDIGKALMNSDWKGAVDLIVGQREGDAEDVDKARRAWTETNDAAKALSLMPENCYLERKVLQRLAQDENQYLQAIGSLTRTMRLMYVHSFQSLVFNRLVSKRVQLFGLEPIEGDMVLAKNAEELEAAKTHPKDEKAIKIYFLSKEDIAKGNYTLKDIILPIPGYSVLVPKNKIADEYHKILSQEGIPEASFDHKTKDYRLSGTYRNICVVPDDLKWEEREYTDVTLPLIQSDLTLLENKIGDQDKQDTSSKQHRRALILTFSLPPSTYATMLVREIIKSPTTSSYMASLNPEMS